LSYYIEKCTHWQGKGEEDGTAKSRRKEDVNSQQDRSLSLQIHLQPLPREEIQGSAEEGGRGGRHQAAWPRSSD